jgi:hypothetical protein
VQLSGLLLIAIGAWLIGDNDVWRIIGFVVSQQSHLFRAAAGLLIAMGIFIILVSIIGFAGAITEKSSLIIIVSILVVCMRLAFKVQSSAICSTPSNSQAVVRACAVYLFV